jgi:hypothetical protein
VTTARNVIVNAKAEKNAPITVTSGKKSVGSVSEGNPTDVPLTLKIPRGAEPGKYTIKVNMNYRYTSQASVNRRGGGPGATVESTSSATGKFTIEISDDAQFAVTEVNSKLYVGEEGRVTGRIKNIGGTDATNTEIEFTPSEENINALSTNIAVGSIPAGESVPFSLPVEVTTGAEAVPHRFDLNVNYRDENGISQSTDDPEFLAEIRPDRDAFLVEPVNNTIQAGQSRPLELRVTNNINETVTDIEGKFFADDPLDSTNDETFTGSLDPGETTTVTVDLSASGGATIKNYPASVDFRYVDSEGDSKLTDSYRMAISVTEPEESGGSPLPLVIGLLVVAGGGFLAWRRGLFERFTG